MAHRLSRRSLLGTVAGGAAAAAVMSLGSTTRAANPAPALKGSIKHSACRWCYGKLSLDELCQAAKQIGLKGIDLVGPKDWSTLQKYGLVCSMGNGADPSIGKGFNHVENHDLLVANYEKLIPQAADAGVPNVICMSGNRAGISDEEGLDNCVKGLKRILKLAEEKRVTVVMELLNSRVDHKDYQADHTAWGVELCTRLGSDRFKLLYDIYHMQIMEGDLIRTIRDNIQYIGHFHTGGNPGRHELGPDQEIHYPAVMRAIVATGYQGFVAQEFLPTGNDPIESLRQCVEICDV